VIPSQHVAAQRVWNLAGAAESENTIFAPKNPHFWDSDRSQTLENKIDRDGWLSKIQRILDFAARCYAQN
jgi:hypothetical protein